MAVSPVRVAIIGHSFIRRLREYAEKCNIKNLNLDSHFSVSMRGKGGLCLKHLSYDASILRFVSSPDICFLQLGENDIQSNSVPLKIATDIIAIANFLHDGVGVKIVLVGQLLRRLPYSACNGFNEKVVEINRCLKAMSNHIEGVEFWSHRGFWADLSYLGPDGVHLMCTPSNCQPMRKFMRSIRNAVLIAEKKLRPVW
ncbi:hypothetical protein FSP39_006411 [Pinctada imbricata]|uniref:SGNH hydrolase-type esterase domain-containing protein n=1 Tax=Pinctada imbricata TaxID=66713 RepID=A0AA88YWY8_PINIB|nr:hypothetical protein FSP39_006411 [Pinctada imbricata]